MKKLSRWFLVLFMALALSACGSAGQGGASSEAALESAAGLESDPGLETAAASESSPESGADVGLESNPESGLDSAPDASVEEAADDEEGALAEGASEVSPGELGEDDGDAEEALPEDGTYTTKEDVALYIHLYGVLPSNFITKKEAEQLGWEGGSLEPYAPGMCIGGNRFGNYEGLLPEAEGRYYTECDIDTLGAGKRGAKRIVFSNDGLIYYTENHYESFELLYGEE